MRGYDQWKTASPPEFDYDPIEEAELFLKRNEKRRDTDRDIEEACSVIEALMEVAEDA